MDENNHDRLTRRLDAALGQARVARATLLDRVVPHLPPDRRGGAQRIVRRIDRSEILERFMLEDIEAVADLAEREAEAGTQRGWACDDQDNHPGWPTIYRDERAQALMAGIGALRRLHAAISAVLDAVEADRLAMRLYANT